MIDREWLDLHGYEFVRCTKCGYADYTDSDGCPDCPVELDTEPGSCLETANCYCDACEREARLVEAAEHAETIRSEERAYARYAARGMR